MNRDTEGEKKEREIEQEHIKENSTSIVVLLLVLFR
jgi:hypothetical protein